MPTCLKPNKQSVLLHIDAPLVDEISTKDGFKLYLAPEWNFEQNTSVVGKVLELPPNCKKNISVGDIVAFSYRTVSERDFPNTADHFVEASEGSPHIKIWYNKKGEMLRILARPGVISLIWTGTYFDEKGRFLFGCQGTESEVGRWIAQFKFGNAEGFVYKNKIDWEDKTYWKCPLDDVFAKKVGDTIEAVGDRVICKPIDIPMGDRKIEVNGVLMTDSNIAMRLYDRAELISGGAALGLKVGDVISFDPQYCEKYSLFDHEYFLIRERRIIGIWDSKLN